MGRAANETGGWHENALVATIGLKAIKKVNTRKPAKMKAPPKKAKKATHRTKGVKKGDPVQIILAKMAEMDTIGTARVKEDILLRATGYARSDSTGFRTATKKLLKELNYLSRKTANKSTTYSLTETGRSHLLENGTIAIPKEPQTNQEQLQQLLETLQSMVKAPPSKLEAIFGKLVDGSWHATGDLLVVAGYTRPDSTGYRNIVAGLNKLDLLETTFANTGTKKTKMIRFGDKAFPFGRPEK